MGIGSATSLTRARAAAGLSDAPVDLRSWDTRNFTRPEAGVASDYVFLVTAMGPKKLERYQTPTDLRQEKLLFSSLISDGAGKTDTVGDLGLILDVRPDNVAGNYHRDTAWYVGTTYQTTETLAAMVANTYPPKVPGFGGSMEPRPRHLPHVIRTPAQLLEKTRGSNEVLLLGERANSPSKVRASGVFIRTRDGKDLATAKEVEAFVAVAKKWRVPVVRIPTERATAATAPSAVANADPYGSSDFVAG